MNPISHESAKEPQLHRLEFRAMGCRMGAWLVSDNANVAAARLNAISAYMDVLEQKLSRFLPESELSRLNARSGYPVQLSPLTWEVLRAAVEAAERTNGLYDPTVLDALESAGYQRTFEDLARKDVPVNQPSTTTSTWRDIRMEPLTCTVTLPLGVGIDLAGIAKGWAAQRCADSLSSLGPCLVDAGGDIAARGSPPGYNGWPVGVANPFNPGSNLVILSVRDRGVATSGVDYRRWQGGGQVQHHIIDPLTRRPAETDLWTVTVVARDSTQADLHALVAMLLGVERGYHHLTKQVDVEGMLISDEGRFVATSGFDQYHFRENLAATEVS